MPQNRLPTSLLTEEIVASLINLYNKLAQPTNKEVTVMHNFERGLSIWFPPCHFPSSMGPLLSQVPVSSLARNTTGQGLSEPRLLQQASRAELSFRDRCHCGSYQQPRPSNVPGEQATGLWRRGLEEDSPLRRRTIPQAKRASDASLWNSCGLYGAKARPLPSR